MAVITLHRKLTIEEVDSKLAQLAQQASTFLAQINTMYGWNVDVLTQDHFDAGLIVTSAAGTPITQAEFDARKTAFAAIAALAQTAVSPMPDGSPSVAARLRPYL